MGYMFLGVVSHVPYLICRYRQASVHIVPNKISSYRLTVMRCIYLAVCILKQMSTFSSSLFAILLHGEYLGNSLFRLDG